MGITDNLAPLFDQGQPGVRFRQGTILTWNAATGENTIDLAGGTLTNVPVLNTSEAIALKAGHIVGLLGQGSSWFLLGRITPANDPAFASASLAFDTATVSATNYAIPQLPTWGTILSTTLDVPSWADEALVTVFSSATFSNTRAVNDFGFLRALVAGATNGAAGNGFDDNTVAALAYCNLSHAHSAVVTSPGSTITVSAQVQAQGGAWTATGSNFVMLTASAVFRSTV